TRTGAGNAPSHSSSGPLTAGTRTVRNSPLNPSSTPATAQRACRSTPTQLPSPIPAPPVIAALPPRHSRRQPAPTYERGAGHSIRSRNRSARETLSRVMLAALARLVFRHRLLVVGLWLALTLFGAFAAKQVSSRWFESF